MEKEQTNAQFIADLLCKREGKKVNLPTPPGYWNQPEWKLKYKRRILEANKFLKIYPFEVIVNTLNSKKYNWVYSLHFPGLVQAFEEENARYERKEVIRSNAEEKKKEQPIIQSTDTAPIISTNKTSLRNRLD